MKKARMITKPSQSKIARLFTASLMSDFKWKKMFSQIGPRNGDLELEHAIVKFIDDDSEHFVTAAKGDWLVRTTPWCFLDLFEFGPVALNSIEWFEFPESIETKHRTPNGTGRLPAKSVTQRINEAEATIAKLGKYPLERTARGLRVVGHVRRTASS